jgi:hypothetical protein
MLKQITRFKFPLTILTIAVFSSPFIPESNGRCNKSGRKNMTISTVEYGIFEEWIPQIGSILYDSALNVTRVRVEIDQLYLKRIFPGLHGSTTINNEGYNLTIETVSGSIVNGRFYITMKFTGNEPNIETRESIRLRIRLNNPCMATLIPVGGFYFDTRGKWIFVVGDGRRAYRRNIVTGKKNTDYFEVVDGLNPGEKVITSAYNDFKNQSSVDLYEMDCAMTYYIQM